MEQPHTIRVISRSLREDANIENGSRGKLEKKHCHNRTSKDTLSKTLKDSTITQISLHRSSNSPQSLEDAEKKIVWGKKKENQRPQERQEIFRHFQSNNRVSAELFHNPYVKTKRFKSVFEESERKNTPTREEKKNFFTKTDKDCVKTHTQLRYAAKFRRTISKKESEVKN
jgi:hypothetical protein